MPTDAQVPDEFRVWLKSFLDHEIDFLLVGGYAVGIHGLPHTIDAYFRVMR